MLKFSRGRGNRMRSQRIGILHLGILLALLIFSVGATSLKAEQVDAISANQQEMNTSASSTFGEGLPNISSRFHSHSHSIDIFACALVWTAKESGTEAWAQKLTESNLKTDFDLLAVDFGWDAGFRVGIGYGMRHDQWDTQLYYTWFRTRGHDHVSGGPGTIHSSFLGNFYVNNPDGDGLSGIAYQKASIDWSIHYNIFDWELGRGFWVSKALSLRPFIGIKGGWIDQSIHSKWQNPDVAAAEFFDTGVENLKNNFWGIGPSAGIDTKWKMLDARNHRLWLFGDLSGAIMYGHWTFSDAYNNDIDQKVKVKLSHLNSGASMVRTWMGLGWDVTFSRGRYQFAAQLGYEMQFWFDQLQYYSFDDGRLVNELTLQGGTLEFRFDF